MTNKAERTLRETYQQYLEGAVTFDDVKLETDRAVDEYQRARGRTITPAPTRHADQQD